MKIDAYSKVVLTVIAACLLWMCLNGVTPTARAQANKPEPARVILVNEQGEPLFTRDGLRVTLGQKPLPLPVMVTNDRLPVDVRNSAIAVAVRAIQRTAVWDPIQVQVLREPPTQMPVP